MSRIHAIIIPIALREACESAAVDLEITITSKPVFCLQLIPASAPHSTPATHLLATGPIPEPARVWLSANLGQFPGAMWGRYDALTGSMEASNLAPNGEESDDRIGKVWSWQHAIADAALKMKSQDYPPNQ